MGANERLCTMEPHLQLKRFLPKKKDQNPGPLDQLSRAGICMYRHVMRENRKVANNLKA